MLASADISIRWRYPPLALAFTGVSLRSLSRPPLCSIHHLGLFTPPSNITPSPNRRRYFSEFPNPSPPSLLSTFPPSLPGNFAAGSCCSGSACGQGLVLPSRTHAPLPPPTPHPKHHHHFHPDTASLSSPTHFFPLFIPVSLSLSLSLLSAAHPIPSSLFPPLSPSLLILPARHGFMVVKHLNPGGGRRGEAGGGREGWRRC